MGCSAILNITVCGNRANIYLYWDKGSNGLTRDSRRVNRINLLFRTIWPQSTFFHLWYLILFTRPPKSSSHVTTAELTLSLHLLHPTACPLKPASEPQFIFYKVYNSGVKSWSWHHHMEITFGKKFLHLGPKVVVWLSLNVEYAWRTSAYSIGPENAKNILCRNITIYGHCRYEKEGRNLS